MFKFTLGALVTAASVFAASPAAAAGFSFGSAKELSYIAETRVHSSTGAETMALCRVSTKYQAASIGFWRSNLGYALSDSGCLGEAYLALTVEDFAAYQQTGLISPDLPIHAKLSTTSILSGFFGTFILVFILAYTGLLNLIRVSGRRKRKAGQTASVNTLAAMCHVAKADGALEKAEIDLIGRIVAEKTGRRFSSAQILQMIEMTEDSLDPEDYVGFGEGLTEEERMLVMEAALTVAVADGEIQAKEHSLVMNLAQGLGIRADQFRAMLASVAEQLAGLNPSANANPA